MSGWHALTAARMFVLQVLSCDAPVEICDIEAVVGSATAGA